MKRLLAGCLAVILFSCTFVNTAQATGDINANNYYDDKIFVDEPQSIYIGKANGKSLIDSANFSDVPGSHWAKDAITRMTALGAIKGSAGGYRPSAVVTKEEALAFAINAIGQDQQAVALGNTIRNDLDENTPTRTLWSLGYLQLARQLNLITADDLDNAMEEDQSFLTSEDFQRTAGATREEVVKWLIQALNIGGTNAFNLNTSPSYIYNYNDWGNIDIENIPYMEAALRANLISGSNGNINPKSTVTRAEMAQILSNLDSIYYARSGLIKVTGTVGGYKDEQGVYTAVGELTRSYYIRNRAGDVDVIRYATVSSSSPQALNLDTVVLRNGTVGGLSLLQVGDEIEYIVDGLQVHYIRVTNGVTQSSSQGYYIDTNYVTGTITIRDNNNKEFTYSLAYNLFGEVERDINGTNETVGFMDVGGTRYHQKLNPFPSGSMVNLTLVNNVVTEIEYLGEPVLDLEINGVVVDNNPAMGYITIRDYNGNEISKQYLNNQLVVKKLQYYDAEDEIGYIATMFPNFKYNPADSFIGDIEPGDIVYLRLDPNNTSVITMISAVTNYTMQYGKIIQYVSSGALGAKMLLQLENGQTAWYDIDSGIFVSEDGYPKTISDIQAGDWAKVLVNQAVLEPGYVIESVKEIILEGGEHYIKNIYRGQLSGIDNIQQQLILQNSQTLQKSNWSNYNELAKFNFTNDVEFYYEGSRVSLDYALRYLKRSNGEVYVATEDHFAGERVAMVSFRNGRDELLPADTVTSSDGNGNFRIITNNGTISTDAGTIVRRNGRLVYGSSIISSDYAVVALNGENKAAVVDITDAPNTSGIVIARGRILSVDEGNSFKVQSMSILTGNSWIYTPIQREFVIDYNTLYYDESGYTSIDNFIGYSENAAVNDVFNIVVDGTRAARILDAPYPNRSIRGTIVSTEGGNVVLKDVSVYDNDTGRWNSRGTAAPTVTIPANSVIVKSNQVVGNSQLQVGDQIRVFTNTLPEQVGSGSNINGYVILVEK